jgi:hypothetical protein
LKTPSSSGASSPIARSAAKTTSAARRSRRVRRHSGRCSAAQRSAAPCVVGLR